MNPMNQRQRPVAKEPLVPFITKPVRADFEDLGWEEKDEPAPINKNVYIDQSKIKNPTPDPADYKPFIPDNIEVEMLNPEYIEDVLPIDDSSSHDSALLKEKTHKEKLVLKQQLEQLVTAYYSAQPYNHTKYQYHELEGKFGTKGKQLTKNNYENVILKLLSLGFTTVSTDGIHRLTIQTQYLDKNLGTFKGSNIRVEIHGKSNIQKYCQTNNINELIDQRGDVKFVRKILAVNEEKEKYWDVVFRDFNFSMSYHVESTQSKTARVIQELRNGWANTKKIFRHINRVSFTHPSYPITIDISIVRSSKNFVPTYNIADSNVFENEESYDIEFELVSNQIGPTTIYDGPQPIINLIHKMSKFILCGLQGSNYPIPNYEQYQVLQSYNKVMYPDATSKGKYPKFIGPSSCTLQRINITPVDSNCKEPNIRNNYCVTDKADGLRHLMFISDNGRIYLINSNLDVMFTGTVTTNNKVFNTIIDGELILHDSKNEFINLFAAFDVYYVNNMNVRSNQFIQPIVSEAIKPVIYRYSLLNEVFLNLNAESIISSAHKAPMRFEVKKFYVPDLTNTIFNHCKKIMENIFEYNIDGLIFTHVIFGVGSDMPGRAGPLSSKTWGQSFKWKPAIFNTIDFLVSTKKDSSAQDIITPLFQDGINVSSANSHVMFKTLILQCGFNEEVDGYINPCQDVIEDKLPTVVFNEDKPNDYQKKQFYPSDPADSFAGVCNMILTETLIKDTPNSQSYKMCTSEGEVFEDDTIVEFKFDKTRYDADGKAQFCWTPLKVRHDKTVEYKKGKSNFGNSYKVANNNWLSIHYPITIEMMMTGENIPATQTSTDDGYYKYSQKNTQTARLRDFHNLFVKKLLINSVSKPGDKLIDYACGKGGDFPKWISSKLSFVFGIDISKNNLEDRIDGICARFLNYRKQYVEMPYGLFVNGDSSLNIRNGSAMKSTRDKETVAAIFGQGVKDETKLGKGVFRQYDAATHGFQISSCQFALHYFFEDKTKLHNFMRNLSECTCVNGYFIGTCYDGNEIIDMLKPILPDNDIELYEDGKKVWQIVKDYSDDSFENDESCIGKRILVYQDSINQLIPEFLVNFEYLSQIAVFYGFALLDKTECKSLRLPSSTGMFRELYHVMYDDVQINKYKESEYKDALKMSNSERKISFLNRYFVFKKIQDVDAEKVANNFILKSTGIMDIDIEAPVPAQIVGPAKKMTETIFLDVAPDVDTAKTTATTKPKQVRKKKILGEIVVEPETVLGLAQPMLFVKPKKPATTKKAAPAAPKKITKKNMKSKKTFNEIGFVAPEGFQLVDYRPRYEEYLVSAIQAFSTTTGLQPSEITQENGTYQMFVEWTENSFESYTDWIKSNK